MLPYLGLHTKLPEETVKELLAKGAVLLKRKGKGTWERMRDENYQLSLTDELKVNYDPNILKLPIFENPECIHEDKKWGVWKKPAGVLTQGTDSGDHTSMTFALEKKYPIVKLIHRLDRETEGLMIVAIDYLGAKDLSGMMQAGKIIKKYLGVVVGELDKLPPSGEITADIDDQKAITKYKVLKQKDGKALLEFELVTGRLHQIRRHVLALNCALWGDPVYGKGNKNQDGLKLAAYYLAFPHPKNQKPMEFTYTPDFADSKLW